MTNEQIQTYVGKAIYHLDEALSALGGVDESLDPLLEALKTVNTLLERKWEEYE